MTLDITKSLDIIETMENYIAKVRPQPEIRHQLDIGYEIQDQSVILQEIRPSFKNPSEIMRFGYAKTTFVKDKNIWKVFWLRSDCGNGSNKKTSKIGCAKEPLRCIGPKRLDVLPYRLAQEAKAFENASFYRAGLLRQLESVRECAYCYPSEH